MAKIIDRFLLFIFSLVVIFALVILLLCSFGVISFEDSRTFLHDVYFDTRTAAFLIAGCCILLIVAVRLFYLSVRTSTPNVPSIDQRTEFGDIRISLDTVENLALKAASRTRGLKDLKARIKVDQAGLEIELRTVVDGETSIPAITEEVQTAIKSYIEDITGIPVARVSVYVANVVQSAPAFKSRVE
ncbi:alkaline shock response membrane anchor protein AmaP [Gorillibacterium timonense]|uniref:alkaline shock response membrane anchor protein AmaP n=1 Tax=Gorillibacterium timonense TaxID=1689269 RepID=UPI00071E2FBA|nr:alkaline shock response membrane anchor protein AmaP [Gorillibacterium timonense]